MTLGDYIKQYREEHGISQRKFATMTGLTNTYISYIERNQNGNNIAPTPTIETYRQVAKATGIEVNQLVAIVEDEITINPMFSAQEKSMIFLFRKASKRDQKIIMDILSEYDVIDEENS